MWQGVFVWETWMPNTNCIPQEFALESLELNRTINDVWVANIYSFDINNKSVIDIKIFPNLYKLLLVALTIPICLAVVWMIIFLVMRRIKTWPRNYQRVFKFIINLYRKRHVSKNIHPGDVLNSFVEKNRWWNLIL